MAWEKKLLRKVWVQRMLGALLALYGWVCLKTSRVIWVGGTKLPAGPALLTVWHGRLCGVPLIIQQNLAMTALVSAHADGQLVAYAGGWWGINMVAGSTNKVGHAQLRTLLRALRGGQVFLTPDGPKGPREKAHTGTAQLAALAKVPLVPVGISVRHAKVMGSWDRALMPRPFSTYAVAVGEPLVKLTAGGLTDVMNALQEQADLAAGRVGSASDLC